MIDIVEQLRADRAEVLCAEAADEIEALRQLVITFETLETKRMSDATTAEDWKRIAELMEYNWQCCSYGFNKTCGELRAEIATLKQAQGEPVAWMFEYLHEGSWLSFVSFGKEKPTMHDDARNLQPLYTSAPAIPAGWQWQHVAATTLARFVSHGTPFEGDSKWAEIADVATKLLSAAPKPGEPA